LTVTFYVNGKKVEQLAPEYKEEMARRLSEAMSNYYTAHPDEYSQIKQ
jgi:hypothetical protein